MQTFDAQIKQINFSFIRVTYGKGDLWYHVSFEKDGKRIPFRITKDNSNTWKVIDDQDPCLLELEHHFAQCIEDFENKILTADQNNDISDAAKHQDNLHTSSL